ncbi:MULTISPECIES: LysR family transcriptional regulator [unclassified Janthinobacterium]|uniref:LysR family transcriptional regulator n=1 Tax=unclassified Janthinobacterium TaxID=2610881 RepID=UPI001612976A|nr:MULTISPECIES: LysR family transcriptional regulator [unclassified Janthinobacterium]MBB5369277.1 DNA-binding transcriptional LysR family regulator [Janthinobacterium sp. K2C7]MBB5381187.1 DNA-binding transcriptional LysR family regulator [Janthinobacterium sp. K2Li3]MBB5387660.1 DNA-binding transcriptional LysR family regulator [Janthinobacterium sp. K2E3]
MLRLDDLQVFVCTADRGSLSAAAREVGISPALASAAVKRLEGELGLRLLARTTRSLSLTPEGTQYIEHAREALRVLRAGRDALLADKDSFGGTLKIAMPSDLGRNTMLGWLDAFQLRHPKLQYQLSVSDRVADMVRQQVDIALRYGQQDDSSMVAMPIAPANDRVLVASPAYLRVHGPLLSVDDLQHHNCLRFALEDGLHDRWTFYRLPQREQVTVQVSGNRSADDADLVRRWAVAGLGIAYKSRLDLSADLAAGRLQLLLPEVAGEPTPLHLVCTHRAQVTPLVLQLRDFLREQCAAASAPWL